MRTQTPGETGWYWIEDHDGIWCMVHLRVIAGPRILCVPCVDDTEELELEVYNETDKGQWSAGRQYPWVGPRTWIGPINPPGWHQCAKLQWIVVTGCIGHIVTREDEQGVHTLCSEIPFAPGVGRLTEEQPERKCSKCLRERKRIKPHGKAAT